MTTFLAAILAVGGSVPQTFSYPAQVGVTSVSVAGTFNGWNKEASPLVLTGDRWMVTLPLTAGRYRYKFVLNGKDWVVDPANRERETDGGGNTNSLLVVFPEDFVMPVSRTDNKIARSALHHEQSAGYLCRDGRTIHFRIKARPGDLSSVKVKLAKRTLPLREVAIDEFSSVWVGQTGSEYVFTKDKASYEFVVQSGTQIEKVGPYLVTKENISSPQVPKWTESTVVYQIFPDRFENGDKSNDPSDVVAWDATPTYANHFGGDFAGVRQHLGYLKDLGIGTVYYNPIFRSRSNHRYDTVDYMQVEPELGTNEEFAKLTKDMAKAGIGTVVDGVFNHTATDFFAFADVVSKESSSAYTNWYTFRGFPVETKGKPNYEAWAGFGSMPKLNFSNPAVPSYMLGVARYWDEKADLAGWRLDVANEIDKTYWPRFRKEVKASNSNRWIIGEIWEDGSQWLQGNMFDSVMGYQFRGAVLGFLADQTLDGTAFINQLQGVYYSYAPQVSRQLMNLLSSHDTPRFLTLCKGDESLARIGATLQFGWPGAPSVYYGEEIAMTGGADPANRAGMQWSKVSEKPTMLAHYKALVKSKREHPALRDGEPVILGSSKDAVVFGRVRENDFAIVGANRGSVNTTFAVPVSKLGVSARKLREGLQNAFDGSRVYPDSSGTIVVRLTPKSSVLLLSREPDLAKKPRQRRTA